MVQGVVSSAGKRGAESRRSGSEDEKLRAQGGPSRVVRRATAVFAKEAECGVTPLGFLLISLLENCSTLGDVDSVMGHAMAYRAGTQAAVRRPTSLRHPVASLASALLAAAWLFGLFYPPNRTLMKIILSILFHPFQIGDLPLAGDQESAYTLRHIR